MIESLAFSGYRSFGEDLQILEHLKKTNIIIGRNNSGKSNILRFIHFVYPELMHMRSANLDKLDVHIPSSPPLVLGMPIKLKRSNGVCELVDKDLILTRIRQPSDSDRTLRTITQILFEKAKLDQTDSAWFLSDGSGQLIMTNWEKAFSVVSDNNLQWLWITFTNHTGGGSRQGNWIPGVVSAIRPAFKAILTQMIPAIRQIGEKGSSEVGYGGNGIIEELSRLQNPDVHNQQDRNKFEDINHFLRNVTENNSARIEVPHDRSTILVHMDGKTLPLESLGSGIHEVIILAVASTLLEDQVICMEEPELHLNPILQKKLIRYLESSTKNQYFISTHSASFIDAPNAEVYHVSMENGCSVSKRVTSSSDHLSLCEDLGYHPSDLLQANCILWVEGPSDRIYLNHWIKRLAPDFVEGIHYSIMFYGGRLAAHVSNEDTEGLMTEFISLRRLNQRGFILIDSDKEKNKSPLNATKERLKKEFNLGPGFAWITQGREVENYISGETLKTAIIKTKPSCTPISTFTQFENNLKIKQKNGNETQASKVDVAKYVVENYRPDYDVLDLRKKMDLLIDFIKKSNPSA